MRCEGAASRRQKGRARGRRKLCSGHLRQTFLRKCREQGQGRERLGTEPAAKRHSRALDMSHRWSGTLIALDGMVARNSWTIARMSIAARPSYFDGRRRQCGSATYRR